MRVRNGRSLAFLIGCAVALLFWTHIGFAQVQIIRPGDFPDASVENMLRQKCEREWPDDFRMRAYCEKLQREGASTVRGEPPSDISGDKVAIVKRKCAAEWPDDFRMRAYCEKLQYTAIRELGRR
jgi:hypothetical protein